jgi:hypothetical protein
MATAQFGPQSSPSQAVGVEPLSSSSQPSYSTPTLASPQSGLVPRGGQQILPFPQLLYLKDSAQRRTSGDSTPNCSCQLLPVARSTFSKPAVTALPYPNSILGGHAMGDRSSAGAEDGCCAAIRPEADKDGEMVEMGNPGTEEKKRTPHAKRMRVVRSCSECRRRKIKCDKK